MRKRRGYADYLVVFCVLFLVAFGLAMLGSASSNLGKVKFGDAYYYLKHQLFYGVSIGAVGFFLGSKVNYRIYEKFAFPMLLISVSALALILFSPLGVEANRAERWLALGPVTFQPSEIVKIFFIIYLASWLSRHSRRQQNFREGFLPFLIVSAIVAGLLLAQPSTGTVGILLATALIMYFMSGARIRYIFGAVTIGAAALVLVVFMTPYRFTRIQSFIAPQADVKKEGFHLNQAQIAIGSGGISGVGYGQSTTKISLLPEPAGDSIFAVIAEELGFIGSMLTIGLFSTLVIRTLYLSRRVRDRFGQLLLVGFGSLIAVQAFVHIGAISGLIPLTGTPLPFVSYGGTAMAVFMTIGGIIVNISKHAS